MILVYEVDLPSDSRLEVGTDFQSCSSSQCKVHLIWTCIYTSYRFSWLLLEKAWCYLCFLSLSFQSTQGSVLATQFTRSVSPWVIWSRATGLQFAFQCIPSKLWQDFTSAISHRPSLWESLSHLQQPHLPFTFVYCSVCKNVSKNKGQIDWIFVKIDTPFVIFTRSLFPGIDLHHRLLWQCFS